MIECRLVQVMAEKRMGRKNLADLSGVSLSSISKMRSTVYPTRIEAGTVNKLCKVLKCSVGDLYVIVED